MVPDCLMVMVDNQFCFISPEAKCSGHLARETKVSTDHYMTWNWFSSLCLRKYWIDGGHFFKTTTMDL